MAHSIRLPPRLDGLAMVYCVNRMFQQIDDPKYENRPPNELRRDVEHSSVESSGAYLDSLMFTFPAGTE